MKLMSPPVLDQIHHAIRSLGLVELVSACELPLNQDELTLSLWVNLSIGGSELILSVDEFSRLVRTRSAAIVELLSSQELTYSRYVFQFVVPSLNYIEKHYACAYSHQFFLIGESSRIAAVSEMIIEYGVFTES